MSLVHRILSFIRQQTPNRVHWLLLTLLISGLMLFVQNQLDGQDMHTLAGRFISTGLSPLRLVQEWHDTQPFRWRLAGLELSIHTLLFIPAFAITLGIWCLYFSEQSLFVSNTHQPTIARFMRQLGRVALAGILLGVWAALAENSILGGWLLGAFGGIPALAMNLIRILKLGPAALATLYVLLHPLGILFSFREAFFRLFGVDKYDQQTARQTLLSHINERRAAELHIAEAIERYQAKKPTNLTRSLTLADYLRTAWRGFLNVQFVVYLLLFMGGIFQLDQFDELFYFLLTEKRGVGVLAATLVVMALWGGMVYVCSKILLFILPNYFFEVDPAKPDTTARLLDQHRYELRLLRNVPVWLAHTPFLLLALTLALNFSRLRTDEQRNPAYALKYVVILLVIALAYYAFINIIHYFHRSLDERNIVLFKPTNPSHDYALLVDLAPRSIIFGQGLLVLSLMLFLPTSTGLVLAQSIGLYAVVMLWLAALAYLGTLLYQFNNLPDYPILVLIVLAVLTFSSYNDNSDIRYSPVPPTVATPNNPVPAPSSLDSSLALQRPDVAAYYRRWLETRLSGVDSSRPFPVIIIATAGGGIRAAAWTTEMLYALNTALPGFNRHLFAISGVSGGGVGAATYLATLTGHRDSTTRRALRYDSTHLLAPLRRTISEDLISPTAASMLFRGGVHNFMPIPVTALDRNRWLEDSYERSLLSDENTLDSLTRQIIPQSFLGLWPSETQLRTDSLDLPALLLNGAVAETGQKIIMTNLNLGRTNQVGNPFYDVADFFASVRRDVPFKTATFLCARFPFVTSGGKAYGPLPNIETTCQSSKYHIIDGGYAENTGILTAVQLIKNLQRVSDTLRLGRSRLPVASRLRYVLLFLPNYAAAETKGSLGAFRFLAEPVKGFLSTWDRNGVGLDQLIGRTLRRDAGGLSFDYTSLTLDTRNHRYPLGWYISPTAVEKMGEQARHDVQRSLYDSLAIPVSLLRQLRPFIGQPTSAQKTRIFSVNQSVISSNKIPRQGSAKP